MNTLYAMNNPLGIILTEGMASISDAAEVNALACRRSDTSPATTPPVQCSVHMYIKHSKMQTLTM